MASKQHFSTSKTIKTIKIYKTTTRVPTNIPAPYQNTKAVWLLPVYSCCCFFENTKKEKRIRSVCSPHSLRSRIATLWIQENPISKSSLFVFQSILPKYYSTCLPEVDTKEQQESKKNQHAPRCLTAFY